MPGGFHNIIRNEVQMTITRREMCFLLPGLPPAATVVSAFSAEDNSIPSSFHAFDQLPRQTHDRAEMRSVLKGKLATGEALEGSRHLARWRRATCSPSSCALRDVAGPGGNRRAYG